MRGMQKNVLEDSKEQNNEVPFFKESNQAIKRNTKAECLKHVRRRANRFELRGIGKLALGLVDSTEHLSSTRSKIARVGMTLSIVLEKSY